MLNVLVIDITVFFLSFVVVVVSRYRWLGSMASTAQPALWRTYLHQHLLLVGPVIIWPCRLDLWISRGHISNERWVLLILANNRWRVIIDGHHNWSRLILKQLISILETQEFTMPICRLTAEYNILLMGLLTTMTSLRYFQAFFVAVLSPRFHVLLSTATGSIAIQRGFLLISMPSVTI